MVTSVFSSPATSLYTMLPSVLSIQQLQFILL
jgi:hypothetical protein